MGTPLDDHLPGLAAVMRTLAEQVDGAGALGRHEDELTRAFNRRSLFEKVPQADRRKVPRCQDNSVS